MLLFLLCITVVCYLKIKQLDDVNIYGALLLVDILEEFRRTCKCG